MDSEELMHQMDSLQMERQRILEYLAKLVLNTRADAAALKDEETRPKEVPLRGCFLPVLELENLVRRFFASYCRTMVCYVRDRGLSLLLHTQKPISDSRQLCRQFLTECSQSLSWLHTPNTITIGIGCASRNLKDIPMLMETAKFAGSMRLSEGRGRVLAYDDYYAEYRSRQEYLPVDAANALRCAVREHDAESVSRIITTVLEEKPNSGEFTAAAISINDLMCAALNENRETEMVEASKYRYLGKNLPPMVEDFETTDQIHHAILQWAMNCMQKLTENDDCSKDPVVKTARRFIHAHFTEQLLLEDVAHKVQLTPSYFSMKFHQETGVTYSSYLTSLRLERAKDLLLCSNLKVKEIADASGFSDSRNFSRVFHRQFGCLPSEFRGQEGAQSSGSSK